ncbi:hypothetical protein KP509_21G031900 [Ceratopteris richardii]|uniref:E3 ubiquitin protein ligase n=1 Tax=Ceratopteris richardii TaxID=49495 RepID=A0A8T2SA54_CERRI|nr:hypothetical protein KP509_21G031900 [Ceratopteris richardii]
MGSKEEPEKKRRHSNNIVSSPPRKQTLPPPEEKKQVDTVELQNENHRLAQQLDVQRNQIHDLELQFQGLKHKQVCFDESFASIQEAWEELVDNVEFLSVRANAANSRLKLLESSKYSEESMDGSIPPEEFFLQILVHSIAIDNSRIRYDALSVEEALEQCQVPTLQLVENVVQAIEIQQMDNVKLLSSVKAATSAEDCRQQVESILEEMRTEIETLKSVMESLESRHNELASEITLCQDYHTRDQAEISRLKGEVEETLADLETSRRKLAALKNQKDCQAHISGSVSGTGETVSKESKELETALADAKDLALRRLDELKIVQQEKLSISEEILKMQESLNEENHITLSAPYVTLLEEAQRLKDELEQAQSSFYKKEEEQQHHLHSEKKAALKAESDESARKIEGVLESRISELESNLEQCSSDITALEARLETESLSSETKDEVAEYKVIVSTLHKEMRMMQQQLNQHKEAAMGSFSLRAEVQSLNAILDRKSKECNILAEKVANQSAEVNALKDEVVRFLRESEQELKLILEMYGRESTDSREARELKQAECRAWAQVERLKMAFDEHTLESKVKEAIEAEAKSQQKLATAEAEIAELRQRIDASDRDAQDASEVLRMKSEEGDAYLTEIETIGQAYEDMQTQNQRLLQQISDRDDYNLKLIFEGFKAKQNQMSLMEEKQSLTSHLKHISSLSECCKQRATRLEEQVRLYSEQVAKAAEESRQLNNALEQSKNKLSDAETDLMASRASLEEARMELEKQRSQIMEAELELENERFERRRLQEELAILNIKASRLNLHTDNGPLIEKLEEELNEYKAILKCSVCHDRTKEVVITKCFHLFCNPCVQKSLDSRHRKCPGCGAVFGPNDVRTVYI